MRINRRTFGGLVSSLVATSLADRRCGQAAMGREHAADVVVLGGGLGGCAAALSALRHGHRVVMTEETDWIGGQLTSQGVPPDEHRWIESHGAPVSYRRLRTRIRDFYRLNYPLVSSARDKRLLNPGNGIVSRLCHEPRVARAVLEALLIPYISAGRLTLLLRYRLESASTSGDRVESVVVRSLDSADRRVVTGEYFVDATELGDLLPLANAEWVSGAESRSATRELHAADEADPKNQQAFTVCFAVDHLPDADCTIDRPADYAMWREFTPQMTPSWPGKLLDLTYTHPRSGKPKRLGFDPAGTTRVDGALNLWHYRRIIHAAQFERGHFDSDICLINWPQNDYFLGNLIDEPRDTVERHIDRAKQLSLSLLYWLQTEAPRPDGGTGFPGLRLRPDVMGTDDGMAKFPYVRESRRIVAERTILEEHVGLENRQMVVGAGEERPRAMPFPDSVGIGFYAIDLHPSTGGDNYIDFEALPFQIPLGALLPVRLENVLPACKNIGTTHITCGCYRLHPVEWGIGEAVGLLVAYCRDRRTTPRAVWKTPQQLEDFQASLEKSGVELAWKG